MLFDDRLATVLRHRAAGERAARTQFRQLLDLLGRHQRGADESLRAAAWLRLAALGEAIPADVRAGMIRDPALRFHSAELAAHFAEDEPVVAAAALNEAHLARRRLGSSHSAPADQGTRVPASAKRPAARCHALARPAGYQRSRVSGRLHGIDHVDDAPVNRTCREAQAQPSRLPAAANDALELSESAETAAERRTCDGTARSYVLSAHWSSGSRRSRKNAPGARASTTRDTREQAAPRLCFRWAMSASRSAAAARLRIHDRCRGPDRLGRPASSALGHVSCDLASAAVAKAQGIHAAPPVERAPVNIDGAPVIAGEWILDAAPRFTDSEGRFFGYAGRMRRAARAPVTGQATANRESDSLRQLLHELRTPVNAIQGFAELIQQQLFGPVPHEYRALAANIAGDSARMLAGFDELDRLAKLESGAMDMDAGSADHAGVVNAVASVSARSSTQGMQAFRSIWSSPSKSQ